MEGTSDRRRRPKKNASVAERRSEPAKQFAGDLIVQQEQFAENLSVIGFQDKRIRGSTFPLTTVMFGLLLMLRAATSLRGAASSIEISEELYRGHLLAGPSHNTVRNHLLRLGLYEISRAKSVLTDWVWIVDHTIQVGNQLCMVVLGIAPIFAAVFNHFVKTSRVRFAASTSFINCRD